MSLLFEQSNTVDNERLPVRRVPARHAEPLSGNGMTVFQARAADVFCRHAGVGGELPQHPVGVCCSLLDKQVVVLAVAAQLEAKFLGDIEVRRLRANLRSK